MTIIHVRLAPEHGRVPSCMSGVDVLGFCRGQKYRGWRTREDTVHGGAAKESPLPYNVGVMVNGQVDGYELC